VSTLAGIAARADFLIQFWGSQGDRRLGANRYEIHRKMEVFLEVSEILFIFAAI